MLFRLILRWLYKYYYSTGVTATFHVLRSKSVSPNRKSTAILKCTLL